MANDANIFKTSLTAAGYVIPKEWSRRIEQVAREASIMRQLQGSIVVYDRVGTEGNTIYIQKNVALTAADVTDGDSIGISALDFNQVAVTADIVGVATQYTLKQGVEQLTTVSADVINNMGLALAEKEESKIFTELYTSTSADVYADGVTSGTITSTNTFDKELILDAITAMRIDKRRGMYLIVHPNQMGDLLAGDVQLFYATNYGDNSVIRGARSFNAFGVTVIESTTVGSVTENSTTVYRGLILGERALAILDKKRPTFEMSRNLIQDLSVTMAAHQMSGYQIINDESIREVKSA